MLDINFAQVFISFIVLLFSLTIHEMAHALREHQIERQGQDDVVLRLQDFRRFLDARHGPHFPGAAVLGETHQVPAVGGRNYVNAFRRRLDTNTPSTSPEITGYCRLLYRSPLEQFGS